MNPQPGVNYYRLKQADQAGSLHHFKPISARIQLDEPVVTVHPNLANPDHVHLRLWNADKAAVRLLAPTGQPITVKLERQSGEADLLIADPLSPGLYWVKA